MAQLRNLGQPFGSPGGIINIPAPAGSALAGQIQMQSMQGLGRALGQYLGQKRQQELWQQDIRNMQVAQQARAMGTFGQGPEWPGSMPTMQSRMGQQAQFGGMLEQMYGDPFGVQRTKAGLQEAQAGQVGLPTPLDPTTGAYRQAQTGLTQAQTGQVGKPTPQTPEERALTKARTEEAIARTKEIPSQLTFDEKKKRDLIAAGIEPKAILRLEKEHIRSQIAKNRAEAEATLRAAKGLLTPEQKISQTNTFRKEFDALSKDYRIIQSSFGKMKAAAEDPSAAGDIAIIFNYMKILDPNSVVRESEYATAENAAGVPVAIRNMWNKALTGERIKFSRHDFMNTAQRLFNSETRIQNKRINRYTDLSKRYGLNPQDVITETDITVNQPVTPLEPSDIDSRIAELEAKARQ